ncbi:gluconate 2-dehydrogenase subunit 3 family protein [Paenibacillus alkalitolerans]|uniref:gluconate 2-dehydrogenase subunit 3 family protein n=1 Tax=Paenibacillus alkalitolerans TaxID=2799335 RepID=UPI0018F5DAC6|nr:gluconate 2-dehydrogenase subunit 3 family protein [Paenibacillus alkalitolerans]
MSGKTRYPSFNVLDEKDAWDDHTQQIVTSRNHATVKYQFLHEREAEILRCICSLLVDDSSPDALEFVISHIDQTLNSSPGEGQRKVGVPTAPQLIRQGLKAMEQFSQHMYSTSFTEIETEKQKQMIQSISEGKADPAAVWNGVPQKELFEKLMRLTVESYCSHPGVWSEMGYAGPAYPRGYVRTQLGQLDPWEAKAEYEA